MTASQRAKAICAKKKNRPVEESRDSECCCMIAPWEIVEEGRSYTLKITKTKEQRFDTTTRTLPEPQEHTDIKRRRYVLHIVAPEPDEKGDVTYKEITSNHTFLQKRCDLKVLVRSGDKEFSLTEGGSFKIDSDGNIKAVMELSCTKRLTRSQIDPDDYKTLAGYIKALEEDVSPEEREKEIKIYLETLKLQEIETAEEKTDMEMALGALFNPEKIAKEIRLLPDGSSKCKDSNVYLLVYPYTKVDGGFSFAYKKAAKTAVAGSRSRLKVTRAEVKVGGKLSLYHGTDVIRIDASQSVGGGSYIRKRKRQYNERGAGRSIFGTMETILNYFKEIEEAQNRYNLSKGRGSSAVKKHALFKFDPGSTGFTVTVKEHELKEIDDDFTIDYASDITLDLQVLDGVSITVDCIEFLILCAGAQAPYVAHLLSSARDRLDKGVGWKEANLKGGATVELRVNGGLKSRLKWKKEPGRSIRIEENRFAGTVGLRAEASIYVEGKLLFLSFKGEAGGSAASAIKPTIPSQLTFKASLKEEDNTLKIGGGIDFTGLALYYVLKGSLDYKKDEENKGNGDGILGSRSPGAKTTLSAEETGGKPIVLFEAWQESERDRYWSLEEFFA